MRKNYVCLECGYQLELDSDTEINTNEGQKEKLCPSCQSSKILKMEIQNPFNCSGG
ncbi:MAG: hypothetical protein LLF28_08530 [Nitrospiraceae bacterium]|nr:hypothetical protein [Nitrospiraceae bacterium]